MLTPQTIDSFTNTATGLITIFIAYCISASLAGAFYAWVAKKMGDDTPESHGFLTLNPLAHIDLLGLALLLLTGWGWAKHIPINPFNITGKWHRLRTVIATYADIFAYITTSIIATIILFMFDHTLSVLAFSTVASMAQAYPNIPSINLLIILTLKHYILLSCALSTFSLAGSSIDMCMQLITKQSKQSLLMFDSNHPIRSILTLFLLFFVFSHFFYILKNVLLSIVLLSSSVLLHFFGII